MASLQTTVTAPKGPRSFRLTRKDNSPKRRVTGTSYSATGAVATPPSAYQELGSARGATIPEIVPELASRNLAIRTYNRMARGDVSCKISLRAGKAPVLGGDFYVEPFDENEENVQIAEFVAANLFQMPSLPWISFIYNVLHMFEYGNSVFEPVYWLKEWAPKLTTPTANRRQYTMLKKMTYLPATTIVKINYDDNGGPASVEHQAIRADNKVEKVTLEMEKLCIFTFEGDGGTLEGESILRSAYEHWFYKRTLYKIDAIQKERHGIGVPDIELRPGFTPGDRAIAHELGRNLRTNEMAYIVRPPGLAVGFAELSGNLVDVLKSAEHHDLQIMKNVLIQFLQAEASSGRATAATSADIFLKTMRYQGEYCCDNINKFIIPNLVSYNFPTDSYPKVKVRNIGEVKDLQMWASAVSNLVDKNVLTLDDETEDFCREVMQFPRRLTPRPVSTLGPSNVKEQYLLRDNPDTAQNEDLAGQGALARASSRPSGAGSKGDTTGNINAGTLSGA